MDSLEPGDPENENFDFNFGACAEVEVEIDVLGARRPGAIRWVAFKQPQTGLNFGRVTCWPI